MMTNFEKNKNKTISKLLNGKKVRVSTILKYDLKSLITDTRLNPFIIFSKKHRNPIKNITPASAVSVEEPTIETKTKSKIKKVAYFTKDDIISFITQFYTDKTSTKKTYLIRYSKVPNFTSDDLKNHEFFNNFVKDNKFVKQILSPISTYLKHNFVGQFADLKNKITAEIGRQLDVEQSKAIQKSHEPLVINAESILDRFQHYIKTGDLGVEYKSNYLKDIDGLILSLYATLPLRDDFGKVSFIDRLNEGYNYLNFDDRTITVLGKKGSKLTRKFKLSEDLMNLIFQSLNDFPRNYLLIKTDGSAKGNADKLVTQVFQRLFDIKVTINDIRKSFTTYAEGVGADEFIKMADIQGHSVATAKIYYSRKI